MPAQRREVGTAPTSSVALAGSPSPEALAAFNGHSSGSAPPWRYQKGDYLVCTIDRIELTHHRFKPSENYNAYDVTISEGAENGGFSIPPGSHRRLLASPVELRRLVTILSPAVGDVLAVAHLGRNDVGRPSRHLFRYSIITRGSSAVLTEDKPSDDARF